MPNFICITCGTQYPESDSAPEHCPICEDERQYINPDGQQWVTLEELRASHHVEQSEIEPGLTGFVVEPKFAIGPRTILVETPYGNYLWDCNSLVDGAAVEAIEAKGGARGIAISHPHFFSSMGDWSRALGNVPIHLHEAHREYVVFPNENIHFWSGETLDLTPNITLIRCGGHFAGSTALLWRRAADGRGVLLTADTIMPVSDHQHVTFMWSFPNYLPLPQWAVEQVRDAVAPYSFERIYGAWATSYIDRRADEVVRESAARYIASMNRPKK